MYSKILNYFLNNIKIPSIPPLLVNGYIISNFLGKAELFNKLFTSQCSPVNDSRALPPFNLRADKIIDKVSYSEDDITQIIKKIPNKSHGWDIISISMIKICDKAVSYSFKLIFQTSFQEEIFSGS